jgi:hypothetical protein
MADNSAQGHKRRTTNKIVEKAKRHAFARLHLPYDETKTAPTGHLLLPMCVNYDRETGDVREQFLWRLGADAKALAPKLVEELGLPSYSLK